MHRSIVSVPRLRRMLGAPAVPSSDFDLNPDLPRPGGARPLRPASVLIPIVERGAGVGLILTRRAALLRHHPGQVAFPGGKQDPGDPTPLAAALREAEEEIALRTDQVEVLGRLGLHQTVTDFAVASFVALVDPGFRPIPDRAEVDEVFEVPLGFVLDPANLQVHARAWQGAVRRYYVIPYGPHYIWGATARILKTLADRVWEP